MVTYDIQRIVFVFNCHDKLQISKVPQEKLRYLINTLLAAYRDNVLVIKLQNHLLDDSVYA